MNRRRDLFWRRVIATLLAVWMGGVAVRSEAGQSIIFTELTPIPSGPSKVFTVNYIPSKDETWYIGQDLYSPFIVNWQNQTIYREGIILEGGPLTWDNAAFGTAILGDLLYSFNGETEGQIVDQMFALNTTTKKWSPVSSVAWLRSATTVLSYDHTLWVYGGLDYEGRPLDVFECYEPVNSTWRELGWFGVRAAYAAGVTFGRYLIFHGGISPTGPTGQILRYDPDALQWTALAPHEDLASRHAHYMFADEEELTIWIVGGYPTDAPSYRLHFTTFGDTRPQVEKFNSNPTINSIFHHPIRRRVFSNDQLLFGELRLECNYEGGCPLSGHVQCPPSFPFRCPSGDCTEDPQTCHSIKPACQEDNMIPCFNGECGQSCEDCIAKRDFPCDAGKVVCCDGSCQADWQDCPSVSCSWERPVRCFTGKCEASTEECGVVPVGTCGPGTALCLDGVCREPRDCQDMSADNYSLDLCMPHSMMCWDMSCNTTGCAELEECSGGGVRCWDERCVDDITQCPPALKAVRMAPFSAVVYHGGPPGNILQLPLRDWNSKEEFGTVTLLTSDLPASVVVKVSRASFHLINQHEEVLDDNENRYHIVGPCFLLSTQQVVVLPTTPWITIHMHLLINNLQLTDYLRLAQLDSGEEASLLSTEVTTTPGSFSVQLSANSSALASFCPVAPTGSICGNGVLEHDEDCDAGPLNSNGPDGPCRKGCRARRCGDGILDPSFGELCDAGPANSDQKDAPCRLDCRPKRCGDGILDSGERCDKGGLNSNSNPRVCRSDCTLCGDGVLDASHEKCDDGLEAGLCVQSGCSCPASCPSPLLRKMVSQRCDCFCPAGQVRDGDECREASAPPTNPSTGGCSPGLPCLGDVLLVVAPTSTNGGDSSSENGENKVITVFEKTTNTPVLVAELKHVTKSVLVEIKSVKPEQHTPQLPSNLRVISQAVELDVVIGAVKAEEEGNSTASSSSSGSSSNGSSSEEESQQVVVLTFSLGPTHQFPGLLKGDQTAFLGSAPAPSALTSSSSSSSSSGGSESETKWKKASKPMTLTIKNDVLFASDQVTKTNGEGSTRYIVLMSAQEEEDGGSGGSLLIIIGASVGGAVLVAIVVMVAGALYFARRRVRFQRRMTQRLTICQLKKPGASALVDA
ncbi:Fibrinogen C-terminal domain-containing protein [Balamuthia mandrillaris]